MKRSLSMGIAGLVLVAGFGAAGPIEKLGERVFKLQPQSKRTFVEDFRAGERASAVVIGDGNSVLGAYMNAYMGPVMAVYVYDRHGNCVAWDDQSRSQVRDDLAVDWRTTEQAYYAIEVCNQGNYGNAFRIAVR